MTTQRTKRQNGWALGLALLVGLSGAAGQALAQPADCPCHRGGGPPGADNHHEDMATIHALFADPSIRRTVREIPNGVETVTESATAEGAALVRKHVAAMHARIKNRAPIHARDPLFAELFANADKIAMVIENTPNGVRVRETSDDPYVVKLIRAHAETVSRFIANGRREMHVDHAVPAR